MQDFRILNLCYCPVFARKLCLSLPDVASPDAILAVISCVVFCWSLKSLPSTLRQSAFAFCPGRLRASLVGHICNFGPVQQRTPHSTEMDPTDLEFIVSSYLVYNS